MSLGQLTNYEVWHCQWENNPNGPCDECAALEGQVFEVGQGPRFPLHPHCKCTRRYHHSAFKPLYGRKPERK